MKFFQVTDKDVSVRGCELRFSETADGIQHVQCPTALRDGEVLSRCPFAWFVWFAVESIFFIRPVFGHETQGSEF